MRIAVLSDCGRGGGAATAATRLSHALAEAGHDVSFLHAGHLPPPPRHLRIPPYPIFERVPELRRVGRRFPRPVAQWLSDRTWLPGIRDALRRIRPSVIHIHNLHGAGWGLAVVRECLRHAPVVWTLHDMWAATGGCAYPFDCSQYLRQCSNTCPQAGVYPTPAPSLVAAGHHRRRTLFRERPNIVLVAPSQWLRDSVDAVTRGDVDVFRISSCVDLRKFRPISRHIAREALGLPSDGIPTLLTVAANLDDYRKGFDLLAEALRRLARPARLLVVGEKQVAPPGDIEVMSLGAISGDAVLPIAYAAADLVVHPSRADNQPLVVLEALACGRPVVALPNTGHRELVNDASGGFAAEDGTVLGLRRALEFAMSSREGWEARGARARAVAERIADPQRVARAYGLVFDGVVSQTSVNQSDLDRFFPREVATSNGNQLPEE